MCGPPLAGVGTSLCSWHCGMGSSLLRCCQHSEVRIATRQSFLILITGFDWLEIATPSHAVGADAPAECLAIAAHPNGGHKNVLHWNLPFGWPWAREQWFAQDQMAIKETMVCWLVSAVGKGTPSPFSLILSAKDPLFSYLLSSYPPCTSMRQEYGVVKLWLSISYKSGSWQFQVKISNKNQTQYGTGVKLKYVQMWELQMHLIVSSKISAKLKLPPTT